ncbi:MAG: TonB-dependent siderophore receptor, partial [Rhizobacter sp.]
MATSFPFLRTPAASAALALAAAAAAAQTATLPPVSVTGRGDPQVGIAGWGDVPLSRAPFSASVVTTEQMRDRGVQRLSDLVRLDPGVSDDYNAEGYWDSLTVRGYEIENHTNHYRDGLPINAETRIPLDNKERVEVLKGTSGLQAGVSAPGGLVNFIVKRPTEQPLREARLAWQQSGSVLAAVDLSQRFGQDRVFGLRLNAATERLAPRVRDADGHRTLFALAGDWRVAPDTLLEAEVETSHRSQPSVPGFSLLGNAVPDPRTIDPRISLNNQPWSLPVVFDGHAASLRFSQRLSEQWRWTAHVATQQLRSDDRVAFPFGCSAEGNFDRFCSDGTYDLYDFRSDDEHRRTDALELALHGRFETGAVAHSASAGVLRSRFTARFQGQAFNLVGIGNIQGTLVTPPDPTLGPGNADRDEDSTELFARDAARLGDVATAWFGVRHSRLKRGAGDTRYAQSFTVPFAALSRDVGEGQVIYASWGQGVETAVTPGLPAYGTQAGQPLPAL